MSEQLTTVRFDRETLRRLKVLADVNDSSVAAEIRRAVDRHLSDEFGSAEFRLRLEQANRERQQLVEGLTGAKSSARR